MLFVLRYDIGLQINGSFILPRGGQRDVYALFQAFTRLIYLGLFFLFELRPGCSDTENLRGISLAHAPTDLLALRTDYSDGK